MAFDAARMGVSVSRVSQIQKAASAAATGEQSRARRLLADALSSAPMGYSIDVCSRVEPAAVRSAYEELVRIKEAAAAGLTTS